MGIQSNSVAVGTAPTKLHNSFSMEGFLYVSNLDNTDTIFIGDPEVTLNSAYAIPKSASIELLVPAGAAYYAISSKTGHSVGVTFVTP
jgi:hypothetical protein